MFNLGEERSLFLVREQLGLVLKDSQTLARGRIEGYRISMLRHASGRIRNVHGNFQERKEGHCGWDIVTRDVDDVFWLLSEARARSYNI